VSETPAHPVDPNDGFVGAPEVPAGNVRGPWYPGSVSESAAHPIDPSDDLLGALTKVTAMFPWPMPRERDEAVCTDMARALDAVLHPLARGRGGVDVAIGDGLDALSKGNRVLRLGYSGIAD